MKPSAVIDTNVVLDLTLFGERAAGRLRDGIESRQLAWIATPAMRAELARVLAYPRLAARGAAQAAAALAWMDAHVLWHDSAPYCGHRCRDADDQPFADLAARHGALLFSKDKALLALDRRLRERGSRVLTYTVWVPMENAPYVVQAQA